MATYFIGYSIHLLCPCYDGCHCGYISTIRRGKIFMFSQTLFNMYHSNHFSHFFVYFNISIFPLLGRSWITLSHFPAFTDRINVHICLFASTRVLVSSFLFISGLWQYRLWSFQGRDTKLQRFSTKNKL